MATAKNATMELEGSALHLLHRAAQCGNEVFGVELGQSDLTPRQLAVLEAIAGREGTSQTSLVAATGIDRSTLADIMGRILKKGLVQRRRTKEDARAYAVTLTEEGRKVLKRAEPAAERADLRLLEALPAASRAQFLKSLATIVDRLADLAPPDRAPPGRARK